MYDFSSMTFEKALGEMETLIGLMEHPETTLEEAMMAYEKGAALKRFCEGELQKAKLRVSKVNLSNEQLELEPQQVPLREGAA